MPAQTLFFVGRDAAGRWVAVDLPHRRGGLFRDRTAALAFVKHEAAANNDAIVIVGEQISLSTMVGPDLSSVANKVA